jgi:hypothetical protein
MRVQLIHHGLIISIEQRACEQVETSQAFVVDEVNELVVDQELLEARCREVRNQSLSWSIGLVIQGSLGLLPGTTIDRSHVLSVELLDERPFEKGVFKERGQVAVR